jgi:hypothetical protein
MKNSKLFLSESTSQNYLMWFKHHLNPNRIEKNGIPKERLKRQN